MSTQLKLPVLKNEKFLETTSNSVYVQWTISGADDIWHGRKQLIWEFKCSIDGKIESAEVRFDAAMDEYKARICGLRPDTKYRISVRSKLLSRKETETGAWRHLSVTTAPPAFAVIVDKDELEIASLRSQLQFALKENKKLETELKKQSHEQWQPEEIVAWISSLGGAFEKYKEKLLDAFTDEGITGAELYMVTESDLKAWGVVQFKDRKLLMRYLSQLTANDLRFEPLSQDSAGTDVLSDDEEDEDQVEEDIKNDEEVVAEKNEEVAVDQNDEAPKESASIPAEETTDATVATEPTDATEPTEPTQPEPKVEADDDQKSAIQGQSTDDQLSMADKILQGVDEEAEKSKNNPKGLLTVTVVGATNVPKVDRNDESDPYVILKLPGLNDGAEQTPVIEDKTNPRWNSKHYLHVNNAFDDVLVFHLYDWNRIFAHKLIGKVAVPVCAVMSSKKITKQYDVVTVADVPKTDCKLEVVFSWMPTRK
eukprot:CAMPEP_0202700068 /NCGR_PEP_ID=MMETSP1385-20130828/13284_1 /ASSEMBLY_ACC=CAM_ASM_000861 /TAXON_ID=933848 /ORGANISM="Elphidium margaritaceum" /LENGTH=481 /DNA_ID=CAMNT_0049357175 /DNA_START=73 /DNA_END=1518 /DNA_ORIENTATION=-